MLRKSIFLRNIILSYLDNEKEGTPLICLHGHYGCGSMFNFIQKIYDGRIILIDQRGHGFSEHSKSYERVDYIDDLYQLIEILDIKKPIILGHSLGGVNAYQYAAKYENISKIIVEDIGTVIPQYENPFLNFSESFDTVWDVQNEFQQRGTQLTPYFMESLFYDENKWKFRFNYDELFESQMKLKGEYWKDWESIDCPILLMHGTASWACSTENIVKMAEKRKNVKLKIYENAGHTLHDEQRDRFCNDVQEFISSQ